jgi:ankyrin repeat protein
VTKNPKQSPLSLATAGRYAQIKWERLAEKDVLECSNTGHTILHHAARQGYWRRVPKHLKDRKYWKESKNGTTVLISAYQGEDQSWVDKISLTTRDILKQNERGESVATLAAKSGRFYLLPKEIVTLEVLQQEISNEDYDTVLHKLARNRQLSAVDKKLLTEDILSAKGNYGETIYHIITDDNVTVIPKTLWTKEAITLQADSGVTPLHYLCQYDWTLIPKNITLKDILIPTTTGSTPLHCWANTQGWHRIPDKFLTKETLELKSEYEATPIESIIKQFSNTYLKFRNGLAERDQNIENKFKNVLSKVNDKTLNELVNTKEKNLLPFIKQEINKRKLFKELASKNQSLEI